MKLETKAMIIDLVDATLLFISAIRMFILANGYENYETVRSSYILGIYLFIMGIAFLYLFIKHRKKI